MIVQLRQQRRRLALIFFVVRFVSVPVALVASVLIEGEGAAASTGDARGVPVHEKVAADVTGDAVVAVFPIRW